VEHSKEILDYEKMFMEDRIKKSGNLLILFRLFRGMYGNMTASFIFLIIKHSPIWVIPFITADMINIASGQGYKDPKWLWIDLLIVTIIIAQNVPTQLLHTGFLSRSSRNMEAGLRGTLIRKLQHLSISYHSELRVGKLQSKVLRDVEAIEALSKQMMYSFAPALLNVVVALAVTIWGNLYIAAFFIVIVPVAVILVYLFRNNIQLKNREFRSQIEEISGKVAETVELIPVTRAHGLDQVEIDKMDTTLKQLHGKGYRLDLAEALFGSVGWVIFTIFQMLCLSVTCLMAYKGDIQVGDVVMYQGYFATLLMSVNQIVNVFPQFTKGFESIHSVSEILMSNELEEYQGERQLDNIAGEFCFEEVSFHYRDTDKHVLKEFNLIVASGECIAFVGESGAGKSTVLNMVIGFYRPTSGRILVDGIPMEQLQMRSYRQSLAVVPQTTVLFSGTIRNNITYGLSDVSDERLQEVIELANLQDVVAEMPLGLETTIGEHGGKLSGGQRQRISIARAMIRDPHIIILDEATSALDSVSEHQVQKAMDELIKGRTTFIVAHRLSTIRNADRIVVMKQGQIVEIGSYDELLDKKGEFYQLKQLQS
jgi:ATP-binding cassette subfamily B protein